MTQIALEQIQSVVGDVDHNRRMLLDSAGDALRRGADLVVFPELATSGYTTDPDLLLDSAEEPNGPTAQALAAPLADHPSGLVCYGFPERVGGGVANSVVLVGRDGPVLHYRKLHLFDAEQEVFVRGDLGLPTVRTDHGTIGLCVCYDSRFVEVIRVLALQGVDVVIAPAAWIAGFDASTPSEGLSGQALGLVVQANLNQVAVVAVSQVGRSSESEATMLGGSLLVDARGEVLLGPLSRTEPESAMGTVDTADIRAARVRGPRIRPREDRRTDVYEIAFDGVRL